MIGLIRILVVADSTVSAEAISRELRHTPACRVIGCVDGRRHCSQAVTQAMPDVVLIDDMSSHTSALARIREARVAAPDAKLVLLVAQPERSRVSEAATAGVDAAVAKTVREGSLGLLVREIIAGSIFFTALATASWGATPVHPGLTGRELEILRLVAAGSSNSRIAAQLWVTEQTVKFHLSNVYRKLGVANRTEASHYAHVHRLLEPCSVEPLHAGQAA